MTVADQLQARVLTWSRQVFEDARDELLATLTDLEPPPHSYELRNSRVVEEYGAGSSYGLRVSYTAPQAEWTDKGTPAHDIPPKPGGWLVFEINGETIFTRKTVHHPGSTKWVGWFTDRMTDWPMFLQDAARRTA